MIIKLKVRWYGFLPSYSLKQKHMKQSTQNNSQQTQSVGNNNQKQPQNKDDIDSRKNEEWDTKGDDVTHNEKKHQSELTTVKND